MIKLKGLGSTIFLLLFLSVSAIAQKVTLHGYITDANNGETLIGASVFVKGTNQGTVTNVYGFYSLSLSPGKYTITYSYMGYKSQEKLVNLNADQKISLELQENTEEIEAVVVTAEAKNDNVVSTNMGLEKIEKKRR